MTELRIDRILTKLREAALKQVAFQWNEMDCQFLSDNGIIGADASDRMRNKKYFGIAKLDVYTGWWDAKTVYSQLQKIPDETVAQFQQLLVSAKSDLESWKCNGCFDEIHGICPFHHPSDIRHWLQNRDLYCFKHVKCSQCHRRVTIVLRGMCLNCHTLETRQSLTMCKVCLSAGKLPLDNGQCEACQGRERMPCIDCGMPFVRHTRERWLVRCKSCWLKMKNKE